MTTRKFQSVLVVDDDPDICEVVGAALGVIAGLDVRTVGSGEKALDIAYDWRPDLVLMDVIMPGIDGPSTLMRMREQALLAEIPVIFLTAKVLPAEVAHFLHLGAIGVISKPFDPLKLGDELFVLWKTTDAARGLDATPAALSQVREHVGSLTENFVRRTREDVVRLRAIIERARHEGRSVLEEAKRIAHSIHGAGAMFGFANLSAAGGAVERLVEGAIADAALPSSARDPATLRRLLNCAERLAQEVEAVGQSTGSRAEVFQVRGG